ncbi:conserved Plasmodium protein, unknown function [Plasmodium knowlesi strain H]|uniref:WD repeat-containing protein 65 n=3 Tax=Plasmodium knowlesi TaxID=5850 RepID=A0A5E7X5T9_PLAKH|nr:WD repeat-containing protein 65, putative [Plasmodium knowlesi strain H]OTN67649.1 Uncharacterized protein PKNOH_S05395400 [Plasmodium knowlesi]CAA9990541.1 WD repeat-containing protein 65, putative [Plasmodium knowlesi strain H]SBO19793.1 conserved Plasmodium protein, unknown function [Plasmodium knowlesi strain H]SBO22399.1 conserved Plasmodium protein, unknown function [Plasmodium knowlesi strain H]VVS80015.1 WD repeat-containing protein 65, putative [Plasmodium knowlesi strain H]
MYAFEKKEETYFTKAIYAYGINRNIKNPFYFLEDNCFFYCIGTNGVIHSLSEKKQKFLLSDESSYGIVCLGISNDRKLLVLGERSIRKPFLSIYTKNSKLVKRLTLEIADNECKIMNVSFSSKNKYVYCLTNGSTKSLFFCYDWLQEKLMFCKIFSPSLFSDYCEICLNTQNSSYIALLSVSAVNNSGVGQVTANLTENSTANGVGHSTTGGTVNGTIDYATRGESHKNTIQESSHIEEGQKAEGETPPMGTPTLRHVFLYHNVERNLVEIKIKNKKLDKIDRNFTNCCWLSDGVLLLTNKNNHLIFYDVKKEKVKICNKHLSRLEVVKVACLSRGFLLFDYESVHIYERSPDLSTNMCYVSNYSVPFNFSVLMNGYCLVSPCEKFLYFLAHDGNLKKFDMWRGRCSGSRGEERGKWDNGLHAEHAIVDVGRSPISDDTLRTGDDTLRTGDDTLPIGGDTLPTGGDTLPIGDEHSPLDMGSHPPFKHYEKHVETVLEDVSPAKINDFDVCMKPPLIILCYDDNVIKIINYKKKEVVMSNSFNNEPLHLSIHCSGHLLLVAFTDKLRLFHILYNKLKIKKEFFLKNCSCCKFSNGGSFMAVSKISTIYIYKTYTYELLYVLKSHVNYITDLVWNCNDFSIFSIGKDGYLFEYSLYNNGNKNMEVMQKDKKFLSIDLEILNEKNKKKETKKENNDNSPNQGKYGNEYKSFNNVRTNEMKNVFVSCDDKTIKQFCNSKVECVLESEYVIDKILLYKNKFLIASFYNGFYCRIRFYLLPLCGLFLEIPCHILNCVNLKLDASGELLFSCSRDGSIYIFSIEKMDSFFLSENNSSSVGEVTNPAQVGNMATEYMHDDKNDEDNSKKGQHVRSANDTTGVYSEELLSKGKLPTARDDPKGLEGSSNEVLPYKGATTEEKKLVLSDLSAEMGENQGEGDNKSGHGLHVPKKKSKMKNNFLMYDLENQTNYVLKEEEKESDDILIDFYYVQKKNKEFLELQKKITNLKNQMELEMKNRESIHKSEMNKLDKQKNVEIKNLLKINKNIIKEKENVEEMCKKSLYELEEKHTYFVNQLNAQFYLTNKICEEKFLKIQEEFNLYKKKSTEELLDLQKEHQMKVTQLTAQKHEEVKKKNELIENLKDKYENLQNEKEEYIRKIEEDVDEEILLISQKYEEQIGQLKKDKYDWFGKFKLYEHIEGELKESIQVEKEKFVKNNITAKRLQESIDHLKDEVTTLKDNLAEKDEEIECMNKNISNLNKKNEELEKLKIVLSQKIKDLESNLAPKNSEIKIMREKIEEMSKCFENNHKKTVNLQIEINEYKMKIKSLHDDLLCNNKTIGNYEKILKNLQEHIKECYLHLHDKKIFNASFLNLYNKFHKVNDVKNYDTKNVFSEYLRQKEHLENMIDVLKEKLQKESEAFRTEKIKMMNENSLLLKEINDLKVDLNFLKAECHDAKLVNRKIQFLRKYKKKGGVESAPKQISPEG